MAVTFEQNGAITPEGQRVIEYIERHRPALSNPAEFNKLSGMIQYYLVNVREGVLTPAQFLRDYPSSANAVLSLAKDEEEKARIAEEAQETKGKVGEVLEQLTALQTELAQARERIAMLEEAAKPKPKRATKKADPVEPEEETPEAEEETEE